VLVGSGWSVKIAGEGRPHECEHIGSGSRASVDSVDKWKTLSVGAAREPSGPKRARWPGRLRLLPLVLGFRLYLLCSPDGGRSG